MKSLLCRPSACQGPGQAQVHEKKVAFRLCQWEWKGCGEGTRAGVAPLFRPPRGWETTSALPTECTEDPLLTHPTPELSLMH